LQLSQELFWISNTEQSAEEAYTCHSKYVLNLTNHILEFTPWITSNMRKSGIFNVMLHAMYFRYLIERWDGEYFINVCNDLGKTALHEAAQNCCHRTVKYLLQHGMV
jgi:ankyrin repeat protein